jgi:NADH-quinone oxidoreductase subunit M
MSSVLSIVIGSPAVGAFALLLTRPARERARQWLALGSMTPAFVASVFLWLRYEPRAAEWQFSEERGSIPMLAVRYALGLDGLSLTLVLVSALTGVVAVWWSRASASEVTRNDYVHALVLQSALLGAFLALDLLLLLVFWQVAVVAALLVVARPAPRRAAVLAFAVLAALAAAAMLAGLLALQAHARAVAGIPGFDLRPLHRLAEAPPAAFWIFGALAFAFVVTAGFLPLLVWLAVDRDDRGAPHWVSLLAAAGLFKLGAYGFLRVALPVLPEAARAMAPVLVGFGVLLAIASAIVAFRQASWTRTLAWASLSHAGVALIGAFALTPGGITGSIVHQVAHAASTCLLFLGLSVVPSRGGFVRGVPIAAGVFVVGMLSFAGAPAFVGYIGLRSLLPGVWLMSKGAATGAAVAIGLAVASVLWFSRRRVDAVPAGTSGPRRDLTFGQLAALLPVVGVVVGLGLYPAPLLWRIETPVARVVMRVSPEFAAEVAGCLQPQTPPAAPPGLPAGMVMAAPCNDGSAPSGDPAKK